MVDSTPEDTSLSDILTASGNGRWYSEGHCTLSQQEVQDISDSVSSGGLSRDLGDIWANGCPKSPSCCSHSDCESSVGSDSTHEKGAIAGTQMLSEVVEISTWIKLYEVHWCQVHTYLNLHDILTLRCVALTWYVAIIAYSSRETPILWRTGYYFNEASGSRSLCAMLGVPPVWQINTLGIWPACS